MIELDIFAWWLERKRKARHGIAFHTDGNHFYDEGSFGCVCGWPPVKFMCVDYMDIIPLCQPSSSWEKSMRRWVDELSGRYSPRDKYSQYEPKDIVWDSLPEVYQVPYNTEFFGVALGWMYGDVPKPRKIHQGTARYYR